MTLTERCRIAGVSTNGYRAWHKRELAAAATVSEAPSEQTETDTQGASVTPPSTVPSAVKSISRKRPIHSEQIILSTVRIICRSAQGVPGWKKMQRMLRNRGIGVGKPRLKRILHLHGYYGNSFARKPSKTTRRDPRLPVSTDRVKRNFAPGVTNAVWVSDITMVRVKGRKPLYVCVFIDLGSRRVMGYSIAPHMETSMVLEALKMGIFERGINKVDGVIVHSDHGSQYASHEMRALQHKYNMLSSMGGIGNSYDNAVAESFWSQMKRELGIEDSAFDSYEEAVYKIEKWIDYYNEIRPHDTLGGYAPVQYEKQL